jgi:hypothetical protein
VTTKDAPGTGRTMWRVLLTLAIVVATASIALVILEPQMIGSYFTVFGMACLIWLSVANLRRLKRGRAARRLSVSRSSCGHVSARLDPNPLARMRIPYRTGIYRCSLIIPCCTHHKFDRVIARQ